MSKKFKGKTCVFCQIKPSSPTGDHVFAREFFMIALRGNLPKVPCCARCNREKSDLEHYLTAVLPFGGRHSNAAGNLQTLVPKRLAKNLKLKRQLEQGRTNGWQMTRGGVLEPTMTLPFDASKLEAWGALVVQGLLWHHWQVLVPAEYDVVSACFGEAGNELLARLSQMRAHQRVNCNLGNGTFVYAGMQSGSDPALTVWEILVFGGAVLGEDPSAPNEVSTRLGVITGPKRMKILMGLGGLSESGDR